MHDRFKDASPYDGLPLVVDTRNVVTPLLSSRGGGPVRLVKA